MTSYTNVNGGATIDTSNNSYLLVALTDDDPKQVFNWQTDFQDVNGVIAVIMDITSTADGHSIVMPDATKTSVGTSVLLNNLSAHNVTIYKNDGETSLMTLNGPSVSEIYLVDNSTANGVWRNIPAGSGFAAVTQVAAASDSSNLLITGSPIDVSGTFRFNFANDLLALSSFSAGTGVAVRTAANSWALRNITGTLNQIVVNPTDGVSGNINISLPTTVTGINSITISNINITGNTISSTNSNGDINIDPNGAGNTNVDSNLKVLAGNSISFFNAGNTKSISFSAGNRTTDLALIWPTVDPINTQVLQYQGAGQLVWANVTTFGGASTTNAIAKFTNTTGTLGNSSVIIDNSNNITGAASLTIGTLQLGVVAPNTISTTSGNLILDAEGANRIQSDNPIELLNGTSLILNDAGNLNNVSVSVGNLSGSYNFTFPIAAPTSNQLLICLQGSPATYYWVYPVCSNNILINGGFDIWQRNTSFTSATTFFPNNDNTYTADCWKLLSNGNNIVNVTQTTGPRSNVRSESLNACRFTVQTANTKFGIIQFLETSVTKTLSGLRNLILSLVAQSSTLTSINYAILSWTGTADSPTSDPISSWNAAGTNPTLVANWNYVTSGIINSVSSSYTFFTPASFNVNNGATVNNLALFLWADNTTLLTSSATLDITCVKLEFGQTYSNWQSDISEELLRCKRWFQKDLPLNTAVGTTAVMPVGTSKNWISATFDTNQRLIIPFPVEMRTAPSTAVAYPVTTTTNVNRMSDNAGADYAANSAVLVAPVAGDGTGIVFKNTGGPLTVTANEINIHWYADCGF
jgi:hypothetical protein